MNLPFCTVLADENRLSELFACPRFAGSNSKWEQLEQRSVCTTAQTTQDGRTYFRVSCPYCSWVNEHGPGRGHRECDGPVMSRWKWNRAGQMITRAGYRMYDCPGYTLEHPGQA